MRSTTIALLFAICAGCATLPDLDGASSRGASAERGAYVGDDGGLRAFATFADAARGNDERRATARAAPPGLPPSRLAEQAARIAGRLSPGESAHWLLDGNAYALDIRLAFADAATRTLDVQYFIWQGDASGTLLAKRLLAAADRGVAVRLLLDDFGIISKPSELVQLEAHERISVRTFNPWAARGLRAAKAAEYLRRASVLNHRMHNKTFIADGAFAILGGRNIGDRYFGIYEPFVQNDLDLLTAGPLADEIAGSFEAFWDSRHSYPVALLHRPHSFVPLADTRRKLDADLSAYAHVLSSFPLAPTEWDALLGDLGETLAAGRSELYVDSPAIEDDERPRLYDRLKRLIASARNEVLISSPYFVPDEGIIEIVRRLRERGVRVAIITNSLATNNHIVAHTGYRRWRRDVLAAGAELYELRADAEVLDLYRTDPVEAATIGLHTKAVVVDGRTAFIGSSNIDPRSMIHNTEVAAVTQSASLSRELAALIERDMQPENAWRVTLDSDGWLTWSSGAEELYRQPARGFGQRVLEFFLSLLPLKNQI
jgi:putative cardiolipin synthase